MRRIGARSTARFANTPRSAIDLRAVQGLAPWESYDDPGRFAIGFRTDLETAEERDAEVLTAMAAYDVDLRVPRTVRYFLAFTDVDAARRAVAALEPAERDLACVLATGLPPLELPSIPGARVFGTSENVAATVGAEQGRRRIVSAPNSAAPVMVVGMCTTVLGALTVTTLRADLDGLAREHGGRFLGWETLVDPASMRVPG